jgi:hypothetical protein
MSDPSLGWVQEKKSELYFEFILEEAIICFQLHVEFCHFQSIWLLILYSHSV